jgi:TolB-like protein
VTAIYRFGRFELNPGTRQLLVERQPVPLGARAFDVLHALVERRERLVTKEELLDLAWPGLVVEENNLQVQVSALRKLLGQDAIATVAGRGYRFTVEGTWTECPAARPTMPVVFGFESFERQPETAPSIAVLPFVNMSPDSKDEYFADGVAEELLNVLSQIRGLRVASRTSAFYFKGKAVPISTIARKLNVSNVLEGSVRRSGKQVRITAQLVHVSTDSHLWSATYDRQLDDIFVVQDEIAQAVVKELRTMLLGDGGEIDATYVSTAEVQKAAMGRSMSAEAYQLYLEGQFFAPRVTRADTAKAIDCFLRAVDLDPMFARAWAALSRAYQDQGLYPKQDVGAAYGLARAAALRAIALEPTLAEAYMALGRIQSSYDWDWDAAKASYRRAFAIAPRNALTIRAMASMALNLGATHEAIVLLKETIALDPLGVVGSYETLAVGCLIAGDIAGAEAAAARAIELSPMGGYLHLRMAEVRLRTGHLNEALEEIALETNVVSRLQGQAIIQHARGCVEESDEALKLLIEHAGESLPFSIAEVYASRQHNDAAFDWLNRAYARRDTAMPELARSMYLRTLHEDVRWPALLKKMKLAR